MKRILSSLALALSVLSAGAQESAQVYNFGFDVWSKTKGAWNLYPEDATSEQKVWDTANHAMSILGINGTAPEYAHLAVPGKGKAAVRIESKKILWAFVAGNLYTGQFLRIVNFKGAEMDFGIPFTGRPKALKGYYHYQPKTIDYAKAPYLSLMGKQDEGLIDVVLLDMDQPYRVDTTKGGFMDTDSDPRVIGKGVLELTKGTDGYVHFNMPIRYNDDRTPKYLVITAASSRYGDFFTGADGSVLYLDAFEFVY